MSLYINVSNTVFYSLGTDVNRFIDKWFFEQLTDVNENAIRKMMAT